MVIKIIMQKKACYPVPTFIAVFTVINLIMSLLV